jgi:membrane protease YdiL (CAAX protease family)
MPADILAGVEQENNNNTHESGGTDRSSEDTDSGSEDRRADDPNTGGRNKPDTSGTDEPESSGTDDSSTSDEPDSSEQEPHEPDQGYGPELPQSKLGLFDRVNNYLLLFYALACFLMFYSVSGLLILSERHILALSVPGIIAFVLPLYLLTRRFSLGFAREYRLEAPDAATAGLVLLAALSVIYPVDTITSVLERRWPPESDYISFLLAIKPKGIWSFIAVAAGTVVVAPLSEELLFRGFIQRILMRNMHGGLAVVLTALIFALAHFSVPLMPAVVLLGIVFGYLFYRTGNLAYPVLAHAAYNFVSLLRLHFTTEEALREAGPGSPSVLWAVLSLIVLTLALVLLERRLSATHAGER